MNENYENYTPRDRVDPPLRDRLMREEGAQTTPVQARVQTRCTRRCSAIAGQGASGRMETRTGETTDENCLVGRSLAMVYSPCQRFEDLYEPETALSRGTIFRMLDKPLTAICRREGR